MSAPHKVFSPRSRAELAPKEELVRLSPQEEKIYFSSDWYRIQAIARRKRLIVSNIIEFAANFCFPGHSPGSVKEITK